MSRRWLLFLVCLGCTLPFLGQVSNARFEIRVDERATQFYFRELAPEVSLVVVNGAQQPQRVSIRLQLLAPSNSVTATTEQIVDLKTNTQKIPFTLPTKTRNLTPSEEGQILWYRLHYLITTDNPVKRTIVEGFISLSEITPDLFKLQVIGPTLVVPGKTYAPRVRATHPLTHKPLKNVKVKGVVSGYDDSDNKISLTSSAVTDSEGFADLKFSLPANLSDDFDITVEGLLGLITIKAERNVDIYEEPTLIVSTDKPIYQPGQTVHARILMLGPSKRALANKEIELQIEDPESTVVSQTMLTTSRFGIASAEWTIPENSRLGDYELEFSADDDDFTRTARIKVSRYDLPTFTVNTHTDRPYYLPGQNATVEVKADYLFGKPVSKGHVRLVRETERRWDYDEQKYETVEGDKYEGDTQSDGVFKAQIDLSEDHESLKEEDYNRFTDLPYVAYFTDPTTNRTERRQFNLRLSKEAIHIYVVRPDDAYYEYRKLPFDIYVSTFYADGTPAPANVSIRADLANGGSELLRQVKTNRFGVAKVPQLRVPEDHDIKQFDLLFSARDNSGRTGTQTDTVPIDDERPAIKVTTRKALLANGEPIEVSVSSTEQNLPITLTVSREATIVKTTQVRLRNGRADLVLPYISDFDDELTVNAYGTALADDEDEQLFWGSHTVLYPRKRDLNVSLDSLKTTYAPGEQAHVSFRASSSGGRGIESALGVVITDKAVDERVLSDEGPTSRYTTFSNWIVSGNGLGSITRKSLEAVDMSKPVPADMAIVAEVLLNQGRGFTSTMFGDNTYTANQASVYESLIGKDIKPMADFLNRTYEKEKRYPKDLASLQTLLTASHLDFSSLRDPWGQPYRPNFYFAGEFQFLSIECSGADKQFGTGDDFSVARLQWPYFRATGEALNAVVSEYHQRTGNYIQSLDILQTELRSKNIDLDALRDPWNQPYKFEFKIDGPNLILEVSTRLPNSTPIDQFRIWRSPIDYFSEKRWKIDSILTQRLKETGAFPQNEAELGSALTEKGLDGSSLRDPWNNYYYFVFQTSDFYGDDVRVESRRTMDQSTRTEQVVIRPVTKNSTIIRIRSNGPDTQKGTKDDFDVAFFTGLVSTQSASDAKPQPARPLVSYTGATGAITGTVTDPLGAVVRGATVTAKSQSIDQVFEATTDDNGRFLIRNIPAGIYEVRASSPGFKDCVISHVIIRSSELVKVDVSLDIGTVAETVTVSSEPVSLMQATTASLVTTKKSNLIFLAPGLAAAKQQLFTPRVREYFPETLLWQPQLTTDKKGRARLDFKLADNITTWRMSVIGSTEDGEIGTAETEIRAFQPFFAELDPPRILTEGDRISLPVVLRNYLTKRQIVDLTLREENWFKILDSNQKRSVVPAGDSKNEAFSLQTIASVKDGKQRVTAIGSEFSDAIEKPVSVHPDGEEKVETVSDILSTSTSLNVNVPINTVPNSVKAEVKIYPHLMTHVWESVEGIMQRPYGCGEQTISSTYPSLMVLRYLKTEKLDTPVAAKAKRYVEEGYQRLRGYQSASGGFAYWASSGPDVALTAYALRFLHDASQVTEVDSSVTDRAKRWLISQQRSDGSWPVVSWDKNEDPQRTAMLTALVARSIAGVETSAGSNERSALVRALDYLELRSESVDEPYLIASYSLAASLAGETARANKANKRLKTLAHAEGTKTYWALETNTPFYGWGLAGRIETTALAIQALAREGELRDPEATNLQARALLFLIFNKDRFGVWYSTQATINVLDAIQASLNDRYSTRSGTNSISIQINGNAVRNIALPTDVRTITPITVDLSGDLKPGVNQVSFTRAGVGSPVSLQVVNTYYIPWQTNTNLAHVRASDSESVRLQTSFDKFEAKIMEEITCRVKAERIGFRGYGMLLAEIGLPPAVDVDRASLDIAVKNSDGAVNHYDVLPDRVVVYLWPRAGGSEFTFKLRPRLAMTAKAAPSTIYDYYNPEAKAVVAPGTFVVR